MDDSTRNCMRHEDTYATPFSIPLKLFCTYRLRNSKEDSSRKSQVKFLFYSCTNFSFFFVALLVMFIYFPCENIDINIFGVNNNAISHFAIPHPWHYDIPTQILSTNFRPQNKSGTFNLLKIMKENCSEPLKSASNEVERVR